MPECHLILENNNSQMEIDLMTFFQQDISKWTG